MSLDTVVEDIREEARARAEEIREDARERADEIVAEAEADAEEIRQQREREAERTVEQEREQTLSAAKLAAKQKRLEARRDVLEDVRERVEGRLVELEGDRRRELTAALVDAAAAEIDADSAVVRGREDDADLLAEILDDDAYDGWSVGEPIDCLGGAVVAGESARVRVDNTFDSILDDVWEDNLKSISDELFDDE